MKKKKKVWIVEFEEPSESLVNDEHFGILEIEEDGIVWYFYGRRLVIFPWRLIEKKEVEE